MNIHYLQHVPFEGPGSIADWATMRGHQITITRLYYDEPFPLVHELDCLIILGGPMGVYDEDKYPWLEREQQFIAQAISAKKAVLGICLGAQLIAHVLGAKIYPNTYKEIGWFPIHLTEEGQVSRCFQHIPSGLEVFHWHGDTFDLPDGATWTAFSSACQHQAFMYNESVIALQFHLETTPQSANQLITNAQHELVDAPFIQRAEAILSDSQRFIRINLGMQGLLESLEQLVTQTSH